MIILPGRKKQPIELIKAKGNTAHLTKEEIAQREKAEIKVDTKKVGVPKFLTKQTQKKEFEELASKLVEIGILTELDDTCLGSYILAKELYLKYTKKVFQLQKQPSVDYDELTKIQNMQDKTFKQVMRTASELGLTITSRCKLVLPPSKDPPKENKFSKFRDDKNDR